MSPHQFQNQPRLVVLSPAHLRGRTLQLRSTDALVGRGANAQLMLDDPHVSRTHAAIRNTAGQVTVQDLGSRSGTTVNGRPTTQATSLRDGDVITFGAVTVRYETAANDLDETRLVVAPRYQEPPAGVRYDVGSQHGAVVSNVAGSQYNSYVQVMQERRSFLRDIAATKTRARALCWVGFLLKSFGIAVWGAVILRFIDRVPTFEPTVNPEEIQLLGPPVWGIPVGVYGIAAIGIGSTLFVVGIVLHIVAASRRRRVDRDIPLPLPAPGY